MKLFLCHGSAVSVFFCISLNLEEKVHIRKPSACCRQFNHMTNATTTGMFDNLCSNLLTRYSYILIFEYLRPDAWIGFRPHVINTSLNFSGKSQGEGELSLSGKWIAEDA